MDFGIHGIWYSVWLNFLVFCSDHLNMIWDFVRIISNKKMFILHFVLFWALSCSFFLGFGSWETCVAEESQQSVFGVAQNFVK